MRREWDGRRSTGILCLMLLPLRVIGGDVGVMRDACVLGDATIVSEIAPPVSLNLTRADADDERRPHRPPDGPRSFYRHERDEAVRRRYRSERFTRAGLLIWPIWPSCFGEVFTMYASIASKIDAHTLSSIKEIVLFVDTESVQDHEHDGFKMPIEDIRTSVRNIHGELTRGLAPHHINVVLVDEIGGGARCYERTYIVQPDSVFNGYGGKGAIDYYDFGQAIMRSFPVPLNVFINTRRSTHAIANQDEIKQRCSYDDDLSRRGIVCVANTLDRPGIFENAMHLIGMDIFVTLHGSGEMYGHFMRSKSAIIEVVPPDMSGGWVGVYYPKIFGGVDGRHDVIHRVLRADNISTDGNMPSHKSVVVDYTRLKDEIVSIAEAVRKARGIGFRRRRL